MEGTPWDAKTAQAPGPSGAMALPMPPWIPGHAAMTRVAPVPASASSACSEWVMADEAGGVEGRATEGVAGRRVDDDEVAVGGGDDELRRAEGREGAVGASGRGEGGRHRARGVAAEDEAAVGAEGDVAVRHGGGALDGSLGTAGLGRREARGPSAGWEVGEAGADDVDEGARVDDEVAAACLGIAGRAVGAEDGEAAGAARHDDVRAEVAGVAVGTRPQAP